MSIHFFKYQGTGNDFIMIDNRGKRQLPVSSPELIRRWCDRRFGIGADGLILLEEHPNGGFEMVYFNADGNRSTMCGNGGRCFAAFAQRLHLTTPGEPFRFMAADGPHEAHIHPDGRVALHMSDVSAIETGKDYYYLNTGSPHYVKFVEDIDQLDVVKEGRAIRYNERFKLEGTNVNFVQAVGDNVLRVATYERGVEDETLSCGTGVTAAALAWYCHSKGEIPPVHILTKGGELEVDYGFMRDFIVEIWLSGPATFVFEGHINEG